MSSIVNKVKDALHSDKDKTSTHPTTSTAHTTDGGVQTTNHNTTLGGTGPQRTDGPATKTDGPHNSNLLNKADPRVDSDRDHSHNLGANPQGSATTGSTGYDTRSSHNDASAAGGIGSGTVGAGGLGGVGGVGHTGPSTTAQTFHDGSATRTDGPHNSNLLNKADPRVDSDRDFSRNAGINPHGTATTGHSNNSHLAHHPAIESGLPARHNVGSGPGGLDATTTGPLHSSGHVGHTGTGPDAVFAGAAGTHTGTHAGGLHSGTSGGLSSHGVPEGTYGQHNSRVANAADPRIDSDLDGSLNLGSTGTTGTHTTAGGVGGIGGAHATGPAPHTAGPHKSDVLNKADPRVDSNLDGSKTVGGDKTFAQSGTLVNKDPTDASQVPPSVLQKHVGGPTVHHEDHEHNRERRHSVSHQEQHRGL